MLLRNYLKNKTAVLLVALAILLAATGIVVYKMVSAPKTPQPTADEPVEILPQVDASVSVNLTKSKAKDNTLVLSISGLGSKYTKVAYEISYESQGTTQGVTSQPLDVSGKDSFVRDDIYMGTCSRNVCRPHLGVKKVSLVLEFTDTSGKKSQFTKDYDL